MALQALIEEKITEALSPSHLEVINESGNHGAGEGVESHFKVIVVSDKFDGKRCLPPYILRELDPIAGSRRSVGKGAQRHNFAATMKTYLQLPTLYSIQYHIWAPTSLPPSWRGFL